MFSKRNSKKKSTQTHRARIQTNDGNCPQVDRRYLSTASGHCKFLIPGRCLVDRVNVNSHVFMPMRFFSLLVGFAAASAAVVANVC